MDLPEWVVPSVAISLSMFRKLLYLVSVFLIPVFAGVENVFYAEVVSDFGGTTMSVIVYLLFDWAHYGALCRAR